MHRIYSITNNIVKYFMVNTTVPMHVSMLNNNSNIDNHILWCYRTLEHITKELTCVKNIAKQEKRRNIQSK